MAKAKIVGEPEVELRLTMKEARYLRMLMGCCLEDGVSNPIYQELCEVTEHDPDILKSVRVGGFHNGEPVTIRLL